ncbi:MAG: glutathionylspermidine synthase family protein, partial [Verrucomicrobia bacterium]|nr:glutathionylspermidine synthase family protein [Verrucomicrobiota bacterium]
LIPSNKVILPVLWALFPNHPFLLEAGFQVTDSLRQGGYVAKPIVGRCGDNILVYDAGNQLVAETSGRFEEQDLIYQALAPLPVLNGNHVQVSAFSVDGHYAGACTRVDPTPIVAWHSDLLPLRILADRDMPPSGADRPR